MVFFRVWKGVTDVTEWLTLSWASGSTSRSQEHRHGYRTLPTEEEALYSRGFIQRSGVSSFFFLLNSTNSSLSDAPFLVLLLRLLLIMVTALVLMTIYAFFTTIRETVLTDAGFRNVLILIPPEGVRAQHNTCPIFSWPGSWMERQTSRSILWLRPPYTFKIKGPN